MRSEGSFARNGQKWICGRRYDTWNIHTHRKSPPWSRLSDTHTHPIRSKYPPFPLAPSLPLPLSSSPIAKTCRYSVLRRWDQSRAFPFIRTSSPAMPLTLLLFNSLLSLTIATSLPPEETLSTLPKSPSLATPTPKFPS